jgi:hypothetical protein
MGIFDFLRKKSNRPDEPGIIDSPWQKTYTPGIPLHQGRVRGYKTLMQLCLSANKKDLLNSFIDSLEDHDGDPDCYTTLNFFQSFLDEHDIHLVMALDWKADIADLHWRVSSALRQNFELTLNLPEPQSYPADKSIAHRGVFSDYDRVLKSEGMQLGFIDTQSDEYVILVHRTADRPYMEKAVHQIGYDYLDINDHKGKLADVL